MTRDEIIAVVTAFFADQEARWAAERVRLIQSLLDLQASASTPAGSRLQTIKQATGTFGREYRTVARNAREFGALIYDGAQPFVDVEIYRRGLEKRRERRRKTPKSPKDNTKQISQLAAHGEASNQSIQEAGTDQARS